ncbi:MAG: DUF3579 domain-containing protein [Nitrosomonas sp.]
MISTSEELLVLGVTTENRPFRPSDWTERICGVIANYDSKGRWAYSELAQPVMHEGRVGVKIKTALAEINPNAYQFIIDFAQNNHLRIIPSGEMIPVKDPVPIAINEEPQETLAINEEIAFSFKKIMTAFLAIHWRIRFPFKNFDYF